MQKKFIFYIYTIVKIEVNKIKNDRLWFNIFVFIIKFFTYKFKCL